MRFCFVWLMNAINDLAMILFKDVSCHLAGNLVNVHIIFVYCIFSFRGESKKCMTHISSKITAACMCFLSEIELINNRLYAVFKDTGSAPW